jgi:hypothetical protein
MLFQAVRPAGRRVEGGLDEHRGIVHRRRRRTEGQALGARLHVNEEVPKIGLPILFLLGMALLAFLFVRDRRG